MKHCIICKRPNNISYGLPNMNGNYCKECAIKLGYVYDFEPLLTKPPNCASSVQKLPREEHRIIHIYKDISKEFLEEYKAEIEAETINKIYNEIGKLIGALEFSTNIGAESLTIPAEQMPLLLTALKNQMEKNER